MLFRSPHRFEDAFVVTFKDGKRIPLSKSISKKNTTKKSITPPKKIVKVEKKVEKKIKQEIADGVIMDPMAMQAIEMGIGEDPMTDDTALPDANGANGGSTADPKSSISSGDQKRAEF